jgi:hypothetical protein
MKKLTCKDAYQAHMNGIRMQKENPTMRFGQAVMLSLPPEVGFGLIGTNLDFYYSDDIAYVLNILYSNDVCSGN